MCLLGVKLGVLDIEGIKYGFGNRDLRVCLF